MAGPTINPTKHFQRQGIDPKMVYAATVVNNTDKSKRGRVQARIAGFMDGIPDELLPWAIPSNNAGAMSGADRAGIFNVPDIGSKIGLRFPLGDPHRPVQDEYPIDDDVMLPEALTNYPKRKVLRFSNGFYIIVDTENNEYIFNNPGDAHITFLGDVTQTIIGNQTVTVSESKGDIPAYLLNAPDTRLSEIQAKRAGNVKFTGLLGGSRGGNSHTIVKGNQTMVIEGNRKVIVKGNDDLQVGRNRTERIAGTHKIDSNRSETN